MTGALKLPARLDLTAAKPLARDVGQIQGDVTVDASGVTHLGALCLQILLGFARAARSDGRGFVIANPSGDFTEALHLFGVGADQLSGKAAR